MKKIMLTFGLLAASISFSQNYNYNSAIGWSTTRTPITSSTPGCYTPVALGSPTTNKIEISSGKLNFIDVKGNSENRMFTNTGNSYDQNFYMDFDFLINSSSANSSSMNGKSVYLAGLSSGTENPLNQNPLPCNSGVADWHSGSMDFLGVSFNTPSLNSNINPFIKAEVLDDGSVVSSSSNIPVQYDVINYVRLEVYANQKGKLIFYTNSTRTIIDSSSCFDMPSNISPLKYLQHCQISQAGISRKTNGWVDNTKIDTFTAYDCCSFHISGPKTVCAGKGPWYYTISDGGDGANVTISPGVNYTYDNNGNIVITNWGNLSGALPKVVTITATKECQCTLYESSYNIYVYPQMNAQFSVSGLGTTGSNYTSFTCTPNFYYTNAVHTWSIYNDNGSGTGPTGQPIRQVGSTPIFNVINPLSSWPTLLASNRYWITHTISFPDSPCPPVKYSNSIYISTKSASATNTNDDIIIYPNPTNDVVNFTSPKEEISSIEIYDLFGKILISEKVGSVRFNMDISRLVKGSYTAKILFKNHSVEKMIVKE